MAVGGNNHVLCSILGRSVRALLHYRPPPVVNRLMYCAGLISSSADTAMQCRSRWQLLIGQLTAAYDTLSLLHTTISCLLFRLLMMAPSRSSITAAGRHSPVNVLCLCHIVIASDTYQHVCIPSATGLFPCILGHEAAGVVESVGEGVTAVKPGV